MSRKTQKKLRKLLTLVSCAVLLVCVTIGATVAYLTSTKTVTNTFTVGKVDITLDEAKVDEYGKPVKVDSEDEEGNTVQVDAPRVVANTYKLVPNHTYTKDPTIHVTTGSEDCWLFVKLENNIKDIVDTTTIEDQMTTDDNWTLIDAENNIYAYKQTVSAEADVKVFSNFKIKSDADVSKYTGKTVVITAYAVQADSFATAQAAWDAANLLG